MNKDPFVEYIKDLAPDARDRGYAWSTAIGLQSVDGLKPSEYLVETAIQNIDGKISMAEAEKRINSYYEIKDFRDDGSRTEEADKVSLRIAEILSETAFTFSPSEYISIHRRLFADIYSHAGKVRDYNITKKEWVLDGETVLYGSASELSATLRYDFEEEKNFVYRGLSMNEILRHLARFVSNLWQIHIFGEGNTRTTAVFFIKYLRYLGFDVTNDLFADHSWYFRNALVRANYTNVQKGVHETTEYLEKFLRNLLLKESNELHNREMHISEIFSSKPDIETEKSDIETEKQDIETEKPDIDVKCCEKSDFSEKTRRHIKRLFEVFGYETVFGRGDVVATLGLGNSAASELLSKMLKAEISESAVGHGKGKYFFKNK